MAYLRILLVVAIVILIGVFWARFVPPTPNVVAPTLDLPLVSATVFPVFDMVRTVGNGVVQTHLILPPGASPHTFEPDPRSVEAINSSVRVFQIGNGLDDWVRRYANEDARVSVQGEIVLRKTQDASDATVDPHYWLSVPNAKEMARVIADALKEALPTQRAQIETNFQSYLAQLDALDAELREILAETDTRQLITFHDAWYYFASEYGFEVRATFEPEPGREPTPQYLAELSRTISRSDIRVIYAEPQFSDAPLASFLADHQARIEILDPLGGATPNDTYINLMRTNAKTIAHNQ